MLEINEVRLYGELSDEPRCGMAQGDGQSWASIRLLTLHSYVGRDRKRVVRKEWVTVKLWGKQADYAVLYLGLGSQVYVQGHLRTEKWVDQATQERRSSLVIVGDEIQALNVDEDEEADGKRDREGAGDEAAQGNGAEIVEPAGKGSEAVAPATLDGQAETEVDVASEEFEQQHGLQPPPWPKARK